jgi:LemA protein
MGTTGWVVIGAAVALVVFIVVVMIKSKNRLAILRNMVEESWRQIDVELQRRHDLIGNLVEVAKASARFEQQTLQMVVQARAQAMQAQGPMAQSQAEQNLNGTMARFFQMSERYPELQANKDFRYLQEQMVECEDRIAAGRRFYNGNVRTFNTRFDTFPSSMFTSPYQKAQYFEVDDPQVRRAPSLKGAFEDRTQQIQPVQQYGQQQTSPWQQR